MLMQTHLPGRSCYLVSRSLSLFSVKEDEKEGEAKSIQKMERLIEPSVQLFIHDTDFSVPASTLLLFTR
jgi:hypothetical protein